MFSENCVVTNTLNFYWQSALGRGCQRLANVDCMTCWSACIPKYWGTPVCGNASLYTGFPSTWECIHIHGDTPIYAKASPYIGGTGVPQYLGMHSHVMGVQQYMGMPLHGWRCGCKCAMMLMLLLIQLNALLNWHTHVCSRTKV